MRCLSPFRKKIFISPYNLKSDVLSVFRKIKYYNLHNKVKISNHDLVYTTKKMFETNSYWIEVPCGKCIECLSHKRLELNTICNLERVSRKDKTMFLTLTYNETNINAQFSLVKKDVQDFLKRLRRYIDYHSKKKDFIYNSLKMDKIDSKLKYFCCGEYGTKRGRPHYHMILYGMDSFYKEHKAIVNKCWQHGFVHFGKASKRSINYTSKYMTKCLDINNSIKDNLKEPMFLLKSCRLGFDFIKKNILNICSNGGLSVDGHILPLGRSFLRLVSRISQSLYDMYRNVRFCISFNKDKKYIDDFNKNHPKTTTFYSPDVFLRYKKHYLAYFNKQLKEKIFLETEGHLRKLEIKKKNQFYKEKYLDLSVF